MKCLVAMPSIGTVFDNWLPMIPGAQYVKRLQKLEKGCYPHGVPWLLEWHCSQYHQNWLVLSTSPALTVEKQRRKALEEGSPAMSRSK